MLREETIIKCLTKAGTIYDKSIDEALYSVWIEQLENIGAEYIERAFQYHFKESVFFPKPADIFALLHHVKKEIISERRKNIKLLPQCKITPEKAEANRKKLAEKIRKWREEKRMKNE